MDKTPIYLNEEEIEVFKWLWIKYFKLKKAKDECKPGNAVLNCDKAGKIKSVNIYIGDDNKT